MASEPVNYLSKIIAGIANCAYSLDLKPHQVDFNKFRSWASKSEELKAEFLSPDFLAAITSLGGLATIRDAYFPQIVNDSTLILLKNELLKRSKFNKKINKEEVLQSEFLSTFEQVCQKLFKNRVSPSGHALKKNSVPVKRELNLLLSDLHFGANLDPKEVPLQYGVHEEARRLAAVIKETINYKPQYRDQTSLNLHLLGDIIQGKLHDPLDGEVLAYQKADALWLLTQAVELLSKHFPRVVVRCATGNHGRRNDRHTSRAVDQKWDSEETDIYYGLKIFAAHLPNVTVEIPYTPYYTYKSFNKYAFATHGDTVLNPGNTGSEINVKKIIQDTSRINSDLSLLNEISLFFVGHVHIGSVIHLPTGVKVITNGCLIPTDPYAQSIGYLNTACGQSLWESVEDFICGDYRFLKVDNKTDQDASLEKLIVPFSGL